MKSHHHSVYYLEYTSSFFLLFVSLRRSQRHCPFHLASHPLLDPPLLSLIGLDSRPSQSSRPIADPASHLKIMTDFSEDERDVELSSITAIFPELQIDPQDSHVATLDIEVIPTTPLHITFKPQALPVPPPSSQLTQPNAPDAIDPVQYTAVTAAAPPDSHTVSYLPSLHLHISLPEGYPEEKSPQFRLSASTSWISDVRLRDLEAEGDRLWEEYGQSQVVYAYIDFLQQEAENAYGLIDIELAHDLKAPLLAYDKATKRKKFEQETYTCGVCLEPKKGSSCYRLQRCGHVFCVSCLQDFYSSAITEGDVGNVKCLDPDCGKQNLTVEQRRRKKQRTLHPNELLEIPLERAQVQRYVDLKLKKRLESDKSTVYCPRQWCQGPAKSAKYARYNTVDLSSYPDSSSDDEEVGVDAQVKPSSKSASETTSNANKTTSGRGRYSTQAPPPDRLNICSVCNYAFCRICQRSWHGELVNCLPRNTTELTAEEQASYDYIRMHTSACPTCNSPCQKTHGCNHMRCFQCGTHFCYLCGAFLLAGDPYRHFNVRESECFMKLWELEEGDEGPNAQGNARNVFLGARRAEMEAQHLREAEALQLRELEEALDDFNVRGIGGMMAAAAGR